MTDECQRAGLDWLLRQFADEVAIGEADTDADDGNHETEPQRTPFNACQQLAMLAESVASIAETTTTLRDRHHVWLESSGFVELRLVDEAMSGEPFAVAVAQGADVPAAEQFVRDLRALASEATG